ncbi:MAG: NAD-dependent epimerase/dehydratase family protein [Ferrimicrobium sp.]
MKATVFGATGFIGSHVAEQLCLAGHEVLAPVRASSDRAFLKSLGIQVVEVDFADSANLERVITADDVVFNCTASVGASVAEARDVDVILTRRLMQAASRAGSRRFLQLSTIVVYGFGVTADPADESTPCRPTHDISKVAIEREETVRETGKEMGIEYVLLRPASTIGPRDKTSFFSLMYQAHTANAFPVINGGKARFSCIDTRDIGRAMTWLAELPEAAGETYLLQGFELSWAGLKRMLDEECGSIAKVKDIPRWIALPIATVQERLSKQPRLTRYAVEALSHDRVWDDRKLRRSGFSPIYSLQDSVNHALADLKKGATESDTEKSL